jgi:hypothetical protein
MKNTILSVAVGIAIGGAFIAGFTQGLRISDKAAVEHVEKTVPANYGDSYSYGYDNYGYQE